MAGGPQITVLGTSGMTFAGNWLYDTFKTPLAYEGHERNFQAYVNTLTLAPGKSQSLLHFVVLGARVTATTSDSVRSAVEATATQLVSTPQISDLTATEICSIANFKIASCADKKTVVVAQPPVPKMRKPETTSKYDVVEKTIGQLRTDMESGVTTSQEITQAYLDRIEFYDKGQLGFHAFE